MNFNLISLFGSMFTRFAFILLVFSIAVLSGCVKAQSKGDTQEKVYIQPDMTEFSSLQSLIKEGMEQGVSGYYQRDTFMEDAPMVYMPVKSNTYQEVWVEEDSVFILSYSLNTIFNRKAQEGDKEAFQGLAAGITAGHLSLCKCSKERSLEYLYKQLEGEKALAEGKISYASADFDFVSKYCLSGKFSEPIKDKGQLIVKLLNGEIDFTDSSASLLMTQEELILKPEAKLNQFNATHFMLNLTFELPEKYSYISLSDDDSELHYVSEPGGDEYYPPESLNDWKRELIKKGSFAQGFMSGNSNGTFMYQSLNSHSVGEHDFSVQYSFTTKGRSMPEVVKAKGEISAIVATTNADSLILPASYLEKNAVASVSYDAIEIKNESGSTTSVGKGVKWEKVQLLNADQKVIYFFNKNEQKSVTIQPEDKIEYFKIYMKKRVLLKLPFEMKATLEK